MYTFFKFGLSLAPFLCYVISSKMGYLKNKRFSRLFYGVLCFPESFCRRISNIFSACFGENSTNRHFSHKDKNQWSRLFLSSTILMGAGIRKLQEILEKQNLYSCHFKFYCNLHRLRFLFVCLFVCFVFFSVYYVFVIS